MTAPEASQASTLTSRLARFAPGLPALLGYRRADLPHDLVASLSVAAVALPVGVAYAQLAGFNPVVGLYVSILALLRFVQLTARPRAEVLGEVEGLRGLHPVARHAKVRTEPGLLLFRFSALLVFFNAPHFKQQAHAAIDAAGPGLRWFVIDALPLTQVDVTGYLELEDLARTLSARGAELMIAGRVTEIDEWRKARGLDESSIVTRHFPTLKQALRDYRAMQAEVSARG